MKLDTPLSVLARIVDSAAAKTDHVRALTAFGVKLQHAGHTALAQGAYAKASEIATRTSAKVGAASLSGAEAYSFQNGFVNRMDEAIDGLAQLRAGRMEIPGGGTEQLTETLVDRVAFGVDTAVGVASRELKALGDEAAAAARPPLPEWNP